MLHRTIEYIILFITIDLLVFWRTLKFQYAADDWEVCRCGCIKPDIEIKDKKICKICGRLQRKEPKNIWQNIWWHFRGEQYTSPILVHGLVILIHIINCILIYFNFGFLTALLFAVHPLAMEGSSVWLSGKPYAMTLMMCLLMFLLKPLAPLFFFATSYFAISGLVAPFVFIHSQYWFWILLIPLFFILKKKHISNQIDYKASQATKSHKLIQWTNIILFFKTIGYYFCLCVFPINLGVHHEYMITYGMSEEENKKCFQIDKFFWVGVALICVLMANFFLNYNQIIFGLLWFFIFIAPWCHLIYAGCNMIIAERYAVISLVGVCYMLVNMIMAIPDFTIRAVVFTALFVYYLTKTSFHLRFYKNILHCVDENIREFPDSFGAWIWKGGIEQNLELWWRAFDSYLQAWKILPYDFRINRNLFFLALRLGKPQDAEFHLKYAKEAHIFNFQKEAHKTTIAFMERELAKCRTILVKMKEAGRR